MGHPIICGYHGVEFCASIISLSFTFVLGVCSIRGALWNCVVLPRGRSRAQLFTTLAPLRASLFTCSAHNAAAPCLCLCACELVLRACGWGGGEGTSPSPSRLITANERTPWRSILASAICNTHYHAAHTLLWFAISCCTLHSILLFAWTGLVQVLEVLPFCLPQHSSPLLEQCSHWEEGQNAIFQLVCKDGHRELDQL